MADDFDWAFSIDRPERFWQRLWPRDDLIETFAKASAQSMPAPTLPKPKRMQRPSTPSPDGLRSAAEAAARLGCSIKTLTGYVEAGALRYVALGHGRKRPRKMFTDADLTAFIESQTRKDVPCQSTRPVARHTGTLTSSVEVIGFTARRNARRAVKLKK